MNSLKKKRDEKLLHYQSTISATSSPRIMLSNVKTIGANGKVQNHDVIVRRIKHIKG